MKKFDKLLSFVYSLLYQKSTKSIEKNKNFTSCLVLLISKLVFKNLSL